jgi:hypothetical protein
VEHPAGPPTVVSLARDHGHESVLQDCSPGTTGVCLLDPEELGLSRGSS